MTSRVVDGRPRIDWLYETVSPEVDITPQATPPFALPKPEEVVAQPVIEEKKEEEK